MKNNRKFLVLLVIVILIGVYIGCELFYVSFGRTSSEYGSAFVLFENKEQTKEISKVIDSVDTWAKNNRTTVVRVDMLSGGYIDYSGVFDDTGKVYVSSESIAAGLFDNGLFLPMNLVEEKTEVVDLGSFDLHKNVKRMDYLYPMQMVPKVNGVWITKGDIYELAGILASSGIQVLRVTAPRVTLKDKMENFRTDLVKNSSFVVLLISLLFLLFYTLSSLYDKVANDVETKRMFGLSLFRVWATGAGQLLIVQIISAAISFWVSSKKTVFVEMNELAKEFLVVSAFLFFFLQLMNLFFFLGFRKTKEAKT